MRLHALVGELDGTPFDSESSVAWDARWDTWWAALSHESSVFVQLRKLDPKQHEIAERMIWDWDDKNLPARLMDIERVWQNKGMRADSP